MKFHTKLSKLTTKLKCISHEDFDRVQFYNDLYANMISIEFVSMFYLPSGTEFFRLV